MLNHNIHYLKALNMVRSRPYYIVEKPNGAHNDNCGEEKTLHKQKEMLLINDWCTIQALGELLIIILKISNLVFDAFTCCYIQNVFTVLINCNCLLCAAVESSHIMRGEFKDECL